MGRMIFLIRLGNSYKRMGHNLNTTVCMFSLCRLRSAETVTASLPLALGLTNKDERWINFNFNSVSRMCKSDDDIS